MKSNWENLRDEIISIVTGNIAEIEAANNGEEDTSSQRDFLSGRQPANMIQPEVSPEIGSSELGRGGRITSDMGRRTDPVTKEKGKSHGGVDIAGLGAGAKAYAVHAGEITFAGYAGNAGNMIKLEYYENEDKHEIVYMHLEQIAVRQGQQVELHQVIGVVGTTGKSTGVHLHLEHRINGAKTRPTNAEINLSVMRSIV